MAGKILVLGATGTVGSPLVEALIAKGETVKAASRGGVAVNGAEGVAFDLSKLETFDTALVDVDRVYVSSPTGVVDAASLLRPFIAAAISKGVKLVIHTAIGVDSDDAIPLRQVELQIERSGLPFVILRPNWFIDNFNTYWLPGIMGSDTITLPAGDAKTSFIAASDIALAAAAALTTDAFDGRALVLTGDEALTYGEAAALISDAAGRPIRYVASDDAALLAHLDANGVADDYAHMLAAIFYPVAQGWTAQVSPHFAELTGRKTVRVADYVKQNAALWRR